LQLNISYHTMIQIQAHNKTLKVKYSLLEKLLGTGHADWWKKKIVFKKKELEIILKLKF